MARNAEIERTTTETRVRLRLEIDGGGSCRAGTGIGFFDHMLALFCKHGLFDLEVETEGDLHVDGHHTIEDTGIVLGTAFKQALGDKTGIVRYGTAYVPMDEALARTVVDLGGRPFLSCDFPAASGAAGAQGSFSFTLLEEFLRAFSVNAAANVHTTLLAGRDPHHMIEAVFKTLGRALDAATALDARVKDVPSTKGTL